jgi:hypothetical protein
MLQGFAGFFLFFVRMNDFGLSFGDLVSTAGEFFESGSPDFRGYVNCTTQTSHSSQTATQQTEILISAQTAFFLAVSITRVGVLLVCRTRTSSLLTQGFRNWPLNIGLMTNIAIFSMVIYVPGLNKVLGARPLGLKYWALSLPFLAFVILSEELRKFCIRRKKWGKFLKF